MTTTKSGHVPNHFASYEMKWPMVQITTCNLLLSRNQQNTGTTLLELTAVICQGGGWKRQGPSMAKQYWRTKRIIYLNRLHRMYNLFLTRLTPRCVAVLPLVSGRDCLIAIHLPSELNHKVKVGCIRSKSADFIKTGLTIIIKCIYASYINQKLTSNAETFGIRQDRICRGSNWLA